MRYAITIDGEELLIDVARTSDGRYRAAVVGPSGPEPAHVWQVEGTWGARAVTLVSSERVLELVLASSTEGLDVYANGQRVTAKLEVSRATSGQPRLRPSADPGAVVAPMPGKVVKVLVQPGDAVERGAPLVVVEAMKMENELLAKSSGRVRSVHVAPGDAVDRGAVLMSIEPW